MVATVVIYGCDLTKATSVQLILLCCKIATVALCGCDFTLLRPRSWLFQFATVGLFLAYFPYFFIILLTVCLVFFVYAKHTIIGD